MSRGNQHAWISRQYTGNITSGCTSSTILARPAGALVRTSRGAIWAGSHHKWEDQIHHIISQLDYRQAAEVEDVITSLLRTRALSDTEDGVSAAVVHFSRPTCSPTLYAPGDGWEQNIQFFRHFKILVFDVPDEFLRSIWSSRLPSVIQALLAGQAKDNLASTSQLADRISEVTHQPTTASVSPSCDKASLIQKIEDLSHQVASLPLHRSRRRSHYSGRRNTQTLSPQEHRSTDSTICRYHRRFRNKVQKCTPPCSFS